MNHRTCILLLLALTATLPGQPANSEKGRTVKRPHAGISVMVPPRYALETLQEPFDICRAVLKAGDQPLQAMTLSAYPVAPESTSGAVADALLGQLQRNLAVRKLQSLEREQMKVAGRPAVREVLSYTFRGKPTLAGRVYLVRKLSEQQAIAYVLTVECRPKLRKRLVPLLKHVAGSLQLTDLRSGLEMPVPQIAHRVSKHRKGFSLGIPAGWYQQPTHSGLAIAQTDYTAGGEPHPLVQAGARDVDWNVTSKQWARELLLLAKRTAESHGVRATVRKQGPAKLGGQDAWQFVIQHAPLPRTRPATAPATQTATTQPDTATAGPQPEPVLIAQRCLCVQVEGIRQRQGYTVIVIYPRPDVEAATKVMDAVAAGFKLLAPATTDITTRPTTRPDASQLKR